ncbi:MAG: hypothetical protein HDR24_08760 [Lachnospiraceae bacterium]|nr:hypothetical protein [Lachnospiraceae bacterium]
MVSASIIFLSCWEPMVRASVIRLSIRWGLPWVKLCTAARAAVSMMDVEAPASFSLCSLLDYH